MSNRIQTGGTAHVRVFVRAGKVELVVDFGEAGFAVGDRAVYELRAPVSAEEAVVLATWIREAALLLKKEQESTE